MEALWCWKRVGNWNKWHFCASAVVGLLGGWAPVVRAAAVGNAW